MSVAANQERIFLRLLGQLRPHWRSDAALPTRIQALLARHRSFGARDRRLYRELIYTTLRYLPWIEPWLDTQPSEAVRRVAWLVARVPATEPFHSAFATGEPPAGDPTELLPGWFRTDCPEIFSGAEPDAQLRRALLWLRLQTDDPETVCDEFDRRGWGWRRSELLPGAIALLPEVDVTQSEAWRGGRIEVQDLGSQLVLESIGIEPGGRWLDACAGAGGKTLQLARLLGPGGQVTAHDVRAAALRELHGRAARAGFDVAARYDRRGAGDRVPIPAKRTATISTVERLHASTVYDGVLVDAPCSGSGTWRRAPHLKWTTTESQVTQAATKQRRLLAEFSASVRPGGRLIYATCSLSHRENEDVVAAFLAAHPDFRPEPFARDFGASARGAGLLILPAQHDSDGFFVASLRRN